MFMKDDKNMKIQSNYSQNEYAPESHSYHNRVEAERQQIVGEALSRPMATASLNLV